MYRWLTALVFFAVLGLPMQSNAALGDENWLAMGGYPGANGPVLAVVQHGSDIYVGGGFTVIGDVLANGVAKWDGSKWSALGIGIKATASSPVRALAVDSNGIVYAGGDFISPGNGIAKWDGNQWSSLSTGVKSCLSGSCSASVYALAIDSQNNLYVGGSFSYAGNNPALNIAMWNGGSWGALGAGASGQVTTLAADNVGNIYVGGRFVTAGGTTVNKIAKWSGVSWSALGSGMAGGNNTAVYALICDSNGNVFAGGDFTSAGGVSANRVAIWNGSNWSAIGTGSTNWVMALAFDTAGNLYRGGGHNSLGELAKWDGSVWTSITTGISSSINAIAFDSNNTLYVGGIFTSAGGIAASSLATLSNSIWHAIDVGLTYEVKALLKNSSQEVYAVQGGKLSKFVSNQWQDIGGNITASSTAIYAAVMDANDNVYVGGQFSSAAGVPVNSIAKWNGTTWSALGGGVSGGTERILALAVDASGNVYAGGMFSSADGVANTAYIAKWNGTSWESLGAGVNNWVKALAVDKDGNVYAGGSFTTAGGIAANGIAKWDGSSWQAISNEISATSVTAIAIDKDGVLYMSGDLGTYAGVRTYIGKWDGNSWFPLHGSGLAGGVSALATDAAGTLYVGGGAQRPAKWNGAVWSSLGSGIACHSSSGSVCTGGVSALLVDDESNTLYVGGKFDSAGVKVSSNIATWFIVDTDGDHWQDYEDAFPNDPTKWLDADSDGIEDPQDNCRVVANADQLDTDGDTQGDVCDTDDDNDGIPDASDEYPLDSIRAGDIDGDGIEGLIDNCLVVANADQLNTDSDAQGDACDSDDDNDGVSDYFDRFPLNRAVYDDYDNDGVPNSWSIGCDTACQIASGLILDNCNSVSNADQLNTDSDAQGDACDTDDDNDGVSDANDQFPLDPSRAGDVDGDLVEGLIDNCPATSNADQLNTDGDGQGNACDNDDDNDGVSDASDQFPLDPDRAGDIDGDLIDDLVDNCPLIANSDQLNTDSDTQGNACDNDDDDDGVPDMMDQFPLNAAASFDSDGDGFPGSWNAACNIACQESSGLVLDNCPNVTNIDQLDTDVDAQGDVCDSDDDNDGIADASDNCPLIGNTDQYNPDDDAQGNACDSSPYSPDLPTSIAAGGNFSCVLTESGGVKCWGSNIYGELGDNSTNSRSKPEYVRGVGGVGELNGVTAIASGYDHSCALTTGGGVKCWGSNYYGELGDNTTSTRLAPVDVTGLVSGVVAIAAGYRFTCAVTMAGEVKCWGLNDFGQLGDGTKTNRWAPVTVSGLTSGAMVISAASRSACVLMATGDAKCWGSNVRGALGDGTMTDKLIPVNVSAAGAVFSDIKNGSKHTCALTSDRQIKCWGDNNFGQLGDGSISYRLTPVSVVGLGSEVASISGGTSNTCIVTDSGSVKCWGRADRWLLGENTTNLMQPNPVDISGLTSGVVEVAVGEDHACVLLDIGAVKCWGSGFGPLPVGVLTLSGDTDSDGVVEGLDNCQLVSNQNQLDSDNDSVGDACDTTPNGDTDNDSIDNLADNCVSISNADQLNADDDAQGNACDDDDDNDSIADSSDVFPLDATESVDADADTVGDNADNCVAVFNVDQLNIDGDSEGNACDNDDDNDSVADSSDAFPLDATESVDTDSDTVGDNADNCVAVANTNQLDTDSDGAGDVCDTTPNGDADNDGVDNAVDNCVSVSNADQLNTDADAQGNVCDSDDDNDGVTDVSDNCPLIANSNQLDYDADNIGDACDDPVPLPEDIAGVIKNAKAGSAVAFAGDVNGDGYGDYVIGMPGYDIPAVPPVKAIKGAGRSEVISGKTGAVLMSVNGVAAKDAMGFAVAGNGDIDNDGFDDVLVGAPNADDVAFGVADVGSATILFGPNGNRTKTFIGKSRKSLSGSAVALADVNGDNHADIIIGAPKADDVARSLVDAGNVTVISGNNYAVLNTLYVAKAKANAGTSVAAGDINHDGIADIIIGAPYDDDFINSRKDAGSVTAYDITGTELLRKYGTVANAHFGKAVASGDVNNDDFDDVLIGAPDDDNGKLKDVGSVTVYSGSDGSQLVKKIGAVAKANLGNSVTAGDVNADGYADIIAGAWKDDSPTVPKITKDTGGIFIWSGNGYSQIGSAIYGSAANDYFGAAVSAGDINSDGNSDVIIGIPGFGIVMKDAGAVKVLSGAGL